MPLVNTSYYAAGWFKNPHFSTIYAAKIRRVKGVHQERERIQLPDADFLDIDWTYAQNRQTQKMAILLHGLEGDAKRSYMLGMSKLLVAKNYDVAAINFRRCSGSPNKLFRSYHSGDTGDLRTIINVIINKDQYEHIVLYGVSLGANVILKYLGESEDIPKVIRAASTIGVPTQLQGSLSQLNKRENWIYRTNFLRNLRAKYHQKMQQFPEETSPEIYVQIRSLRTFDDLYTAPAHGFQDANDYYTKASSFQFLPNIKIPVFVLNAKNDTFLDDSCYPYAFAKANKHLFLETPKHGGHVGFYLPGDFYYNELRSISFFEERLAR